MYLDKRPGGSLDYLTVNENATEPPVDGGDKDINSPQALSSEATNINRHYLQCVLKEVNFYSYIRMSKLFSKNPTPLILEKLQRLFVLLHIDTDDGI